MSDIQTAGEAAFPGVRAATASAIAMLCLLSLVGLASLADMLDGPGTVRQELVAQTPELSADPRALRSFPRRARHYVTERYALKDPFVSLNGSVMLGVFGRSPYPKVLVGESGILFLNHEGTLEAAQGRPPAARDEAWIAMFERMDAAFRSRGIPLVQVIAPDKAAVLPEALPRWVAPVPVPRSSQLAAKMRDSTAPQPVDLARVFRRLRRDPLAFPLYHATDTHWTEYGAARGIDAALAPVLGARALPPLKVRAVPAQGGDLARMVGRQAAIRARAPQVLRPGPGSCSAPGVADLHLQTIDPLSLPEFTCRNPDAPQGHALVFMDSFGMAAAPRLAQIFRRVDFLWQDEVDMAAVDRLRPDIALRIMVGRKLQSASPAGMFAAP
ncbi:hypothetical protein [Poseidonocella sp. HB161398]|uniref:alginate O-acetyltransferase AlgX-related protein n=1 Tax=Poseidonocella sp. HB161398 TaxID=2320855 RepID=UPI001485F85D|nr:hypothetical protein [Poseidonocella sp. HB161398]